VGARLAWNGSFLVIESETVRRRAVGCIGFHEKVFKLRCGFILICGDWDRASMRTHCFGPGLDPVARNHNLNAERCHLVIEV
jgi:hypothetical protein